MRIHGRQLTRRALHGLGLTIRSAVCFSSPSALALLTDTPGASPESAARPPFRRCQEPSALLLHSLSSWNPFCTTSGLVKIVPYCTAHVNFHAERYVITRTDTSCCVERVVHLRLWPHQAQYKCPEIGRSCASSAAQFCTALLGGAALLFFRSLIFLANAFFLCFVNLLVLPRARCCVCPRTLTAPKFLRFVSRHSRHNSVSCQKKTISFAVESSLLKCRVLSSPTKET